MSALAGQGKATCDLPQRCATGLLFSLVSWGALALASRRTRR